MKLGYKRTCKRFVKYIEGNNLLFNSEFTLVLDGFEKYLVARASDNTICGKQLFLAVQQYVEMYGHSEIKWFSHLKSLEEADMHLSIRGY